MRVIQVKRVNPEPAAAASSLPGQDRLGGSDGQELGRDYEPRAFLGRDLRQRGADDPLRASGTVCLGSVDQRYPELNRATQQRRGDLRGVTFAVAPLPGAELPGTKPNAGDVKPGRLHVTHHELQPVSSAASSQKRRA